MVATWAILSILAALFWAISNNIDKYIFSKWIKHKHPYVPILILGLTAPVPVVLIYLIRGFSSLSFSNIAISLVAGAVYVILGIFYVKAAQIEEISRVVPLFYLAPAFTAMLAALFLGEIFSPIKYIGIFLLMAGAILISVRSLKELRPGKAFWFMLVAALSWGISLVLTKYVLNFTPDYWTVFAYSRIGTMLGIIPLYFFFFKDLVKTVKEHGAKVVAGISTSEAISLAAFLFITIASVTGFVTFVNALAAVQPFFVLAIAVFLSIFFPKILKEEISTKTIALKAIAIGLIFIGAVIVT